MWSTRLVGWVLAHCESKALRTSREKLMAALDDLASELRHGDKP
jgi:hypothetical protein